MSGKVHVHGWVYVQVHMQGPEVNLRPHPSGAMRIVSFGDGTFPGLEVILKLD